MAFNNQLVSVISVNFGGLPFLQKLVKSIKIQMFPNYGFFA